jgi:hypothetical protein
MNGILSKVLARLAAVADFLFGYDFFVSYAHKDVTEYPQLLRERLATLGYRTFRDVERYKAGGAPVPQSGWNPGSGTAPRPVFRDVLPKSSATDVSFFQQPRTRSSSICSNAFATDTEESSKGP